MTPQEFREAYLIVQDRMGNRLQTLSNLSIEFTSLMDSVVQDYQSMNQLVDEFLNQQENSQSNGK